MHEDRMLKNNRVARFLVSGLIHCPFYYLVYLVMMIGFGLAFPFIIALQKTIIDTATHQSVEGSLIYVLIPVFIGYLILNYVDTISVQISTTLNMKILHILEQRVMFTYLRTLSSLKFEAYEHEETHNAMMRIAAQQKNVFFTTISLIPNVAKAAIELGSIGFFMSRAGIWWAFPLAIVVSLPAVYFNKRRAVLSRRMLVNNSFEIRYADYVNDVLLNREAAKERRFFRFYPHLSKLWKTTFKKHNAARIRTFTESTLMTGIAMCFSMAVIPIIGYTLLAPLKSGAITIGLYTAIIMAVTNKMNGSMFNIIKEYNNITNARHYLDDVDYIRKIETIHVRTGDQNTVPAFENMVFDDVYFTYPHTDTSILKGVSFEITRHEHHALIGVNGAGKTTITKLMMGLYAPEKGTIYLNGKNINRYSYPQIRQLFAAVQQNYARYKTTLGKNLGVYGLTEHRTDHDRYAKALGRCESLDILARCKHDYDTFLTTEFGDGIMLSGGEWQKVIMARALYAERDCIILDEPTAALDPLAEVRFYENFGRLMNDHTCLFITHRLGSTYLFKNCFVLSDGKIVERGSHTELMALNGIYKDLYEQQQAWYSVMRDA